MAQALYLIDDQRLFFNETVTAGDIFIIGADGITEASESSADALQGGNVLFTIHHYPGTLPVEMNGILAVFLQDAVGI